MIMLKGKRATKGRHHHAASFALRNVGQSSCGRCRTANKEKMQCWPVTGSVHCEWLLRSGYESKDEEQTPRKREHKQDSPKTPLGALHLTVFCKHKSRVGE